MKLYKRFFSDVEYMDKNDALKPYTIMTVQGRQYPWMFCDSYGRSPHG